MAGTGYVALFVLAVFANFFVIESMTVDGDPAATLAAITAEPGLFRLGIAAFLIIAVIDVVVAGALHILLRDTAPDRSKIAAWLRLMYAVFLGVALASLMRIDHLTTYTTQIGPSAATEVTAALDTFTGMWMVGLLFFGLHLAAVASLLVGPARAPKMLRLFLSIAGAAYVVDSLLHVTLADYTTIAPVMLVVVAVPSVVGEAWFGGWLLLRAGRAERLPSTRGRVEVVAS